MVLPTTSVTPCSSKPLLVVEDVESESLNRLTSCDRFQRSANRSRTAFGDGSVIVERYVQQPRHVEVQLIGDRHGRVEHLGTRECSVQRRYQKLFEEAPAPNLSDTTRNGLHEAAFDSVQPSVTTRREQLSSLSMARPESFSF